MALEHRPTFSFEAPLSPEAVQSALATSLPESRFETRWARTPNQAPGACPSAHLVVSFRPEHRHFWSPWLSLDVEAHPKDGCEGTRIFGRFSPHPAVWTAWSFTYLGLAVLAFFSAIFATSQWSLGETPSAFWGTGGCVLIAASMWWGAQLGQRLAHAQMEELRRTVEAAMRAA